MGGIISFIAGISGVVFTTVSFFIEVDGEKKIKLSPLQMSSILLLCICLIILGVNSLGVSKTEDLSRPITDSFTTDAYTPQLIEIEAQYIGKVLKEGDAILPEYFYVFGIYDDGNQIKQNDYMVEPSIADTSGNIIVKISLDDIVKEISIYVEAETSLTENSQDNNQEIERICGNISFDEIVSNTIKDDLSIIIEDCEFFNNGYQYRNIDNGILADYQIGISGHFSYSRELTIQEYKDWGYGGFTLNASGEKCDIWISNFSTHDGIFALELKNNAPPGNYTFVLYQVINEQICEVQIPFTIF